MTKTYAAARAAYKQGKFPALRVSQDSGSYFWIENEDGRGLECFVSREAAERHLNDCKDRAAKWIAA